MKYFAVALALFTFVGNAYAQSVQQSGHVTPGHVPVWATNGVIKDGGTPSNPVSTGFGVVGGQICTNSGPITGPYNAFCMQATPTGGGVLSLYNYNGAIGGFSFNVNGTTEGFPVVPLPTTTNDIACFSNTAGSLVDCGYQPGTLPLVVGSTGVNSGTDQYILYNNAGTLGNKQYIPLANGGLGTSQAAATAGQVPVYPGSGGSAVPGVVANAGLADMAADTVKCNPTGSTASAQDCPKIWANILEFGAVAGDNTKYIVNQTAFASAFAQSNAVYCPPGQTFYVQKITIPTTATILSDCTLVAAGTYAGNDAVVSAASNTAGFTFQRGSITVNATNYASTADIQITGSTRPQVVSSVFGGAYISILLSNNTDEKILYNTITGFVDNAIFDNSSGGGNTSVGVLIQGNRACCGTDIANAGWNDNVIIVLNSSNITMTDNVVTGAKVFAYAVQSSTNFLISNNIAISGIRECVAANGTWGEISGNQCFFNSTSTDYCMSFGSTANYFLVQNNLCYEPRYTGMYFNDAVGGIVSGNQFNSPAATNNSNGWAMISLDGTSTGMTISNNAINDFHTTLSWYYWKAGGSPTGNYIFTNYGPAPSMGIAGNSFDLGNGVFGAAGYNLKGVLAWSSTVPTVASGFCSTGSPVTAISVANGTAAFDILIGAATCGSTGTLTMPAATTGWVCGATDVTTPASHNVVQTGTQGSTTAVVLTDYSRTAGTAQNFNPADHIHVMCTAY